MVSEIGDLLHKKELSEDESSYYSSDNSDIGHQNNQSTQEPFENSFLSHHPSEKVAESPTIGSKRIIYERSIPQNFPVKKINIGHNSPFHRYIEVKRPSHQPLTNISLSQPTPLYKTNFGEKRLFKPYRNYQRESLSRLTPNPLNIQKNPPDMANKILQTLGKMSTPLEEVRSRRSPLWIKTFNSSFCKKNKPISHFSIITKS